METNVVSINRVTIHSFKSIKNLTFTLYGGENLVIEGKNGLGKSNILNAIYWCINGTDLNGCTDQTQFIPFRIKDFKADVEIYTNVGKIERIVEINGKGETTQTVKVDDMVYTLKDYEIEIDKRFGLLPFTLNIFSNKDFKLREFLMNPTYHLRLTPKTIRDILAKRYSFELTERNGFVTPHFNPLFINLLKENDVELDGLTNYYQPIEKLNLQFENDKKILKAAKENYEIVKSYLTNIQDGVSPKVIDDLEYQIKETNDSINKVEEKLMILESGKQTWNECLEKNQKGLLRVVFQTTTSKGTKKNTFAIEETGIDLKQVSTSENVIDSINLAELYKQGIGCNVDLPIFIDRAESINNEKFIKLRDKQVLLTKVTTGRKIKINGNEVQ